MAARSARLVTGGRRRGAVEHGSPAVCISSRCEHSAPQLHRCGSGTRLSAGVVPVCPPVSADHRGARALSSGAAPVLVAGCVCQLAHLEGGGQQKPPVRGRQCSHTRWSLLQSMFPQLTKACGRGRGRAGAAIVVGLAAPNPAPSRSRLVTARLEQALALPRQVVGGENALGHRARWGDTM